MSEAVRAKLSVMISTKKPPRVRPVRLLVPIVMSCLTVSCVVPESSPTFPADIRARAGDYVKSLPESQRIVVWPSKSRTFVSQPAGSPIGSIVSDYFSSGERPVQAFPQPFFANVIVIYAKDDVDLRIQIAKLTKQHVLSDDMVNYLDEANTRSTGCVAKAETNRGMWINDGVGVIVESRLEPSPGNNIRGCVYAMLDYINGFPMPDDSFQFGADTPEDEVRNAVLWAYRECSREEPQSDDVEQTRDGVSPFPSNDCVLHRLSQSSRHCPKGAPGHRGAISGHVRPTGTDLRRVGCPGPPRPPAPVLAVGYAPPIHYPPLLRR
jgi:hypothetical protein